MPKFIVVTGGVLSGLGKGIVAASIGRLLRPKYRIVPIKCDGYLNVDPGTMNPIEHGEVFVLDDGGEVDLDFGHYERFLSLDTKFSWNLTSGKIFQSLVEQEREGKFLGKTVQVIPHVTGEIKRRLKEIAEKEKADVVIIEIGGTVGDLENLWFLEACRELAAEVKPEDILFIHMGFVPVIDEQGQQKTKPIQQSAIFLRERGIFPKIIIGRSKDMLLNKTKEKIHWLMNIPKDNIFSDPDTKTVYELPLILEREGLREIIGKELNMDVDGNLNAWSNLVKSIHSPNQEITVAICGKYTELADSYISIEEALSHSGAHEGIKVKINWIETTDIETGSKTVEEVLRGSHAVIVPGGFGSRGVEGKVEVIRCCRENKIPYLGICFGMQLAVIEYARNVCNLSNAHSTEIAETGIPVIDLLPEQKNVYKKGGSMRLGGYDVILKEGSMASKLFDGLRTRQRFRHRWEVNPDYIEALQKGGLIFSGHDPSGNIMQFIELPDHPYFVGAQFHPELSSRLENPSPLFSGLLRAASRKL